MYLQAIPLADVNELKIQMYINDYSTTEENDHQTLDMIISATITFGGAFIIFMSFTIYNFKNCMANYL